MKPGSNINELASNAPEEDEVIKQELFQNWVTFSHSNEDKKNVTESFFFGGKDFPLLPLAKSLVKRGGAP